MTFPFGTFPFGADSSYLLDMYGRYRRDPAAVPMDWRLHFEGLDGGESGSDNGMAARLQEAFRRFGHREAKLDPLALHKTAPAPQLEALRAEIAHGPERMATFSLGGVRETLPLGAALARLETLYAGTVGLEAEHIDQDDARDWLYGRFEESFGAPSAPDMEARALESILLADTFETFLKIKFPSKKRFGVEGAESMIVFMREALRAACLDGFGQTVIGGMHRGRLATLATVLGKPVGVLLAEIKGRDLTDGGPDYTGDVPYHLGYSGEVEHEGRRMAVSITPHPSHLITVAPVATGLARALSTPGEDDTLCLLMHTDAAFSGQGLVAEVMQLGGLAGYTVGGTVHLVVNNQIGFTTNPDEGRTARYCTDIAKMVGAPVLHVNGEDPLAVARVAALALAWRRAFRRDIVIDLICYRRNGHNELDEPRFTQPDIWSAIDARPSLRQSYSSEIAARDPAVLAALSARADTFRNAMQRGYEAIDSLRPNQGRVGPPAWADVRAASKAELLEPVETGLPLARLRALGAASCQWPETLQPHAKVAQFYAARLQSYERGEGINLASAEALAFATLLDDGVSVRLSGQDCVRGTFTQRHLALHDMGGGGAFMPLAGLARNGARFQAINSPLIEYGVLGFEYGHSLASPGQLTVWEAQFGDFLNGAQIMVDQFIASAEAKWQMMSGLVVLLPHGLEGQGPDHSSARPERLLQLAAGGNIIIANPSTPANLFHLLRRQSLAPWRKPLFVIAPKSLLRQKACQSTLASMGPGTAFAPVIAEEVAGARRIILCSGKFAYELEAKRAALGLQDAPVVRIEQLYPFPAQSLRDLLARAPGADLVFAQEEPENQGAAYHVMRHARAFAPERPFTLVARPPLPVAAGGSIERHEAEQDALLCMALTGRAGLT